jgi:uncharacterized paraquat-inducible protein A
MPVQASRKWSAVTVFLIAALVNCLCLPWVWSCTSRADLERREIASMAPEIRHYTLLFCLLGAIWLPLAVVGYVSAKIQRGTPRAFDWWDLMLLTIIWSPLLLAAVYHRQLYGSWAEGGKAEPMPKGVFIALEWMWLLLCISYLTHAAWWFASGAARRQRARERDEALGVRHCERCGYNLTANVSGRCPECGTPIPTATEESAESQSEHEAKP